ncbi:photosystem II 5 kDa protein, chloroplastic-like [Cornus florida]|uniref:photosystem II 5 kDa protein, chloroplastic-like n=1 Tax=Cornus florida TaxID=4283 RepID=UPI00289E8A2F|nr:photosystem II 5 kDa protein, chloroplastic-like [Cornus florida]
MASITMTASLLGGAALSNLSPATTRRGVVITNSAKVSEGDRVKVSYDSKRESNNGRRELMFAGVTAAVCSFAATAVAEVKQGTPEAKKFSAPVCVTMPTARVCHK